jgi:hypothetical protein
MKAQEIADIVNSLHDRLIPTAEKFLREQLDDVQNEAGKILLTDALAIFQVSLRDFTADLVMYSLIALLADDPETVLKALPDAPKPVTPE